MMFESWVFWAIISICLAINLSFNYYYHVKNMNRLKCEIDDLELLVAKLENEED